MKLRFLTITKVMLLFGALLVLAPLTVQAQDNVELSNPATNDQPRVTTSLSATDEQGLPLPNLTAKDVEVTENGVVQSDVSVYSFFEHPTPVNVILVLDTSGSMKGQPFEDAKNAAVSFVDTLGVNDRVGLVTFARDARVIQPATGDFERVKKAIRKLRLTPDTALYDAVALGTEEANKSPKPRVVVLMTDGANWKSVLAAEEALAKAKATTVPVHTIGFGPNAASTQLERIAKETGGNYYEALGGTNLEELFAKISQQLHQEYRLSYESTTSALPGDTVEVRVRLLKRPGSPQQVFTYVYGERGQAQAASVKVSTGNLAIVNPGKTAGEPSRLPYDGFAISTGAGFATLALLFGVRLAGTRSRVQQRLLTFVGVSESDVLLNRRRASVLSTIWRPLVALLSPLVLRVLPAKQQRKLAENLASAPYPRGMRLAHFVTLKTVLMFVAFPIALMVAHSAVYAFIIGLLSFRLPDYWLAKRIKQRRRNIVLQLPDALDLLTISVEAGLGFDGAMLEVVQKWDNELGQEFSTVLGEMKLGKSRRDALRALSSRVKVQEVQLFVSAIVQADEIGMSISRTLSIQAEQMRVRRRQRAEELAHKAVIKIIFPMVFFIFPALFVVLLGPSIPSILNTLSQMSGGK
ncbi:MAG: VWA domain-containing protein [Chloroflexota bacterium]|nr:VWA domain-containing protein [Chloroflexota bacterium]